jgi:uncharacterized protein (DUF305 family)
MFKELINARRIWNSRTIVLAGAALLTSLSMPTVAADKMAPMSKEQHESMPAKGDAKSMTSMDMHKSMMKGMKDMESMPMTGNADHDFAMMMKMHHQGALDMANVELQQGKDPKLRSMAKKIIESQKKEIKAFDDWLAKHKQPMATSK